MKNAGEDGRRALDSIALLALLLGLLVLASAAHGAGELDPTFHGDGRVVTDFGANDGAGGVAIQADGKIVVAAEVQPRTPATSPSRATTPTGASTRALTATAGW